MPTATLPPEDSQRHRLRDHVLLSASDIKKGRVATYLAEQRVPCCPTKRKLKPDRPGEGSVRTLAEVRTLVAEAAAGGAGKKKAFDPEAPMLGWYSFFVMGKPLLLDAARAFQRAPHVRASATAVARSLFGGEPYLAVHLRREATQVGVRREARGGIEPIGEWGPISNEKGSAWASGSKSARLSTCDSRTAAREWLISAPSVTHSPLSHRVPQLGCSKGSPSVLCPLNGSEWTIDTAAVESQIRRAATAAAVTHVYIATIWPPQVPKRNVPRPNIKKKAMPPPTCTHHRHLAARKEKRKASGRPSHPTRNPSASPSPDTVPSPASPSDLLSCMSP